MKELRLELSTIPKRSNPKFICLLNMNTLGLNLTMGYRARKDFFRKIATSKTRNLTNKDVRHQYTCTTLLAISLVRFEYTADLFQEPKMV